MTPDRQADGFPRQHARTRRFTLGRARSFQLGDDVALFLRSPAGDDPVTDLWMVDLATGIESRLVAAADLVVDDHDLPAAERARRERAREQAAGITSYAVDEDLDVAVFTVAGRLHAVDVPSGEVTALAPEHVAFDPRPSPDGARVAFVDDGGVHVASRTDGTVQTVVAGEEVTWGVAEFVAAEELQRHRGHWWSPDGQRLAVTRVDEAPVQTYWIGDPANPQQAPAEHRYPAAGTANADVGLSIVELEERRRVDVRWDRDELPYLADVLWRPDGDLTLVTLDRAQSRQVVHSVDLTNGATEVVAEHGDDAWIDVVPGAPRWLPDGRLLTVVDASELGEGGTRTLAVDGQLVGPAGVQVRAVLHADATSATVAATTEPTERHLARIDLADGAATWLTDGVGVHAGAATEGSLVVAAAPGHGRPHVEVRSTHGTWRLADHAEEPLVTAQPRYLELGPRGLRGVLLTPSEDRLADGPLPVLLDPYGGPHAQRAIASQHAHLTSQWFADHGFAVLVVDGRGTPGRGPAFERAVRFDLAAPVLEDQLDALHAAAELDDPPGPGPGRDPWLVVRRLPRRPGRDPTARHHPGRDRGRPGHRLAALRHRLHRALPRPPRRRARGLRPQQRGGHRRPAARRGARAGGPAAAGHAASSTAWPTTTSSPPTRCGCRRPCWRPADPTSSSRCQGSPT